MAHLRPSTQPCQQTVTYTSTSDIVYTTKVRGRGPNQQKDEKKKENRALVCSSTVARPHGRSVRRADIKTHLPHPLTNGHTQEHHRPTPFVHPRAHTSIHPYSAGYQTVQHNGGSIYAISDHFRPARWRNYTLTLQPNVAGTILMPLAAHKSTFFSTYGNLFAKRHEMCFTIEAYD